MKKRLLVLLMGIFFVTVQALSQTQQKVVSGKVTDEDALSLPGVSVKIKGTTTGTQTDAEGAYSIRVNQGQVLVFSFLGTVSQEKTVGSASVINIVLKTNHNDLNEVVIVGYGTQKKSNLTGAVTTVDVEKAFSSKPINDPTKALQGVVPGLTITYGNGGLTSSPVIRLRGIGSINGSSTPLLLVDNVETSDLSLINPSDIESISVLKDAASTSIYGARAAFGVVLIKTKTGKRNSKTSVTYSNNFAFNTPTILPEFSDPVPELQALYDANVRSGTTSPEIFGMQILKLKDGIANWQKNYSGNRTSNEMVLGEDFEFAPDGRVYFYRVWDVKEQMLKDYTQSQIHNLKVQGGSEKMAYYISAGTSQDGGILKMNPDEVKKYNISASINSSVNKWLDLDAKMLYRNYKYESPFGYQGYNYYMWRWGSYFPYGTYNGNYFRHTPAYLAGAQTNEVTDNYQRIDVGTTVKLTPKLKLRGDYTIGRDNAIRHEVGGPIMAWDFWSAGTPPKLANIASASQDMVKYGNNRYLVNTLNAYATYQDTVAKNHNLKLTAGVNAEDYRNIIFSAERRSLLDAEKGELGLATGEQFSTGSNGTSSYAGYFGRLNYDYNGKYLLEINGRYDGSSSFSTNDRWAFFPSASVGYRLTEEKFMDPLKSVLKDVKIRASYGSLGNQNVGGNFYVPSMSGSAVNWINGAGLVQGIAAPISVANSLTWEKVTTLNVGTDVRLFNDLFGITFDWFNRTTSGMLANTSVPATFGASGPKINSGDFRSKGWELSIDANHSVNDNLRLYGTLTLADSKTEFTKWNNPSMLISQNFQGATYGDIWGFETDRYFTSPEDILASPSQVALQNGNFVYGTGDVKYKDLNGDGVINSGLMTLANHGDLKVIGNSQPRYQYGARLGGVWKNLDFDLFIQGVGKRDFWGSGNVAIPLYQGSDILYANQLDYWTSENNNAYYPRPYIGNNSGKISGLAAGGNNFYPQSKYLLDLSYLRLKNATLGYSFKTATLKKANIQKLRVYVSGQNLAELSNVGAPIDPEVTDGELGFIGRTFPFQRMYSFGLDLTF